MTKLAKAPTDVIVVPTYDDARTRTLAEKFAEEHAVARERVLAMRIETHEDAGKAAELATRIVEIRETLAAELEPATQLRRAANQISARWNGAIKPLDECLEHLRREQAAFVTRQREAAALALPQAQTTEEVQAAVALIAPAPEGVQVRESWSAEVTMTPAQMYAALLALGDARVAQVLAASLPPAYLLVDQSRLNAEARAQHEAFAVSGAKAVKAIAIAHTRTGGSA